MMQEATQSQKIRKNLNDFYESLPSSYSPKINFVREASYVCGVTENTVRNWIKGRNKPIEMAHLEYLSRVTGIPVERLFAE